MVRLKASDSTWNPFRWWSLVLTGTGLLAALVLVALALAGFASGWRYLELMSDFRPHLLWIGTAFTILAAGWCAWRRATGTRRRWEWMIPGLAAMSVAIHAGVLVPWYFRDPPVPAVTPLRGRLKAMSFNVENVNRRFDEVVGWVGVEQPDFMFFLESVEEWPSRLVLLRSSYPHHLRLENLTMDVYSRYPLRSVRHVAYGPSRGFRIIEVNTPAGRLEWVVVHACPRHYYGSAGYVERRRLLREGLVRELPRGKLPTLVQGDFNASPWSSDFREMIRGTGFSEARQGIGFVPTTHADGWLARWLPRCIDHALHAGGIVVHALRTGPPLGSDHLPLVVEFSLP